MQAPMDVWAVVVSSVAATPYPRQAEYPDQRDYDLRVRLPVPAAEAGNRIVCRASLPVTQPPPLSVM